jgi:hypothetical protein
LYPCFCGKTTRVLAAREPVKFCRSKPIRKQNGGLAQVCGGELGVRLGAGARPGRPPMASIAQAVTTSISGAANPSGGDPATAAPATLPVPTSEGGVSRPQDTVNLTETGGRNVPVVAQGAKPQPAFQVTYFPPTSVQGAASQPSAAVSVAVQQSNCSAGERSRSYQSKNGECVCCGASSVSGVAFERCLAGEVAAA